MIHQLISILGLFLLFGAASVSAVGSQLEGVVTISPSNNSESERILPNTPVQLQLLVRNVGEQPNNQGDVWIRYALPKPLDSNKDSILYSSEKVALPTIPPGEERIIHFDKLHYLPTIYDFIRNDWGMRKYEAIVNIKGQEMVIGSRPLTFSAYYYLGPPKL